MITAVSVLNRVLRNRGVVLDITRFDKKKSDVIMRSMLFWAVMQRRLVVVSYRSIGKPIGPTSRSNSPRKCGIV
jgi:hypothetical protein